MSDIKMPMKFRVDLEKPLVTQQMSTALQQGDVNANVILADVRKSNKAADLSAYEAEGYVLRGDGERVLLPGTIEGGEVQLTLDAYCYQAAGACMVIVRLKNADGIKRTILRLAGYVESEGEGPILDPANTLPNWDSVVKQLETMIEKTDEAEEAAKAANEAAQRANNAAQGVEEAQASAKEAAQNANTAATYATAAADQAVLFGKQAQDAAAAADTAAENAEAEAESAKSAAKNAVQAATNVEDATENAKSAATDARSAAGFANSAANSAMRAATEANAAAGRAPYIGENGNWYTWDTASGAYVDTGVAAGGGSSGGNGDEETEDDVITPPASGGGGGEDVMWPETNVPNQQLVTNADGNIVWEAQPNVENGAATGTLRTSGAAAEDDSYAMGENAFAEGYKTKAFGAASHAEGDQSHARAAAAHAEGQFTSAYGEGAHSEGVSTTALGYASHAEGEYTLASGRHQHTQGKFNVEDGASRYAHIVGNGTDNLHRSNAHTLDWDGNAWFKGKVYVGGTSMDDATELGTGGGTGGSLPTGGEPHQMLVTDVDGNTVWDDRTHYRAWITETIVDVTGLDMAAPYIAEPVPLPTVGAEYTVNWNGTEYVCVAKTISMSGMTSYVFGNVASLGMGADTGEPFCILVLPPETGEAIGGVYLQVVDSLGTLETVDVKVSREGWAYTKLDYAYMPDGYPIITRKTGELLPETEIVRVGVFTGTTTPLAGSVIIGETYTVNWNGTAYQTTAKIWADQESQMVLTALGNLSYAGAGDDTGEPFVIAVATPETASFFGAATAIVLGESITEGTSYFSISGMMEIVTGMDSRFIQTAINNATKYSVKPYDPTEVGVGHILFCADFMPDGTPLWLTEPPSAFLQNSIANPTTRGALALLDNGFFGSTSEFFVFDESGGSPPQVDGIILRSPNDKHWKITVDDNGTLTTTEL